jgi:hypothetical protein
VLPSPAAALQRASSAFGFDFARLRQARRRQHARALCGASADRDEPRAAPQELKLDFYGCIKLINFVRSQVCAFSALSATQATLPHAPHAAASRCRLRPSALKMQLRWTTRRLGSRRAHSRVARTAACAAALPPSHALPLRSSSRRCTPRSRRGRCVARAPPRVRACLRRCRARCGGRAEQRASLSAQYLDDAFLTPVLENDTLLFGLDVDEADFGDAADAGAGAAAAGGAQRGADTALAVENELLKLQARLSRHHATSYQ